VGSAVAFLALLQGWLLCVGFVCLANVLKIAWGRVGKVHGCLNFCRMSFRVTYNEQGLLQGWNSLLVLPGTAAD
jgi:hypothetical protein